MDRGHYVLQHASDSTSLHHHMSGHGSDGGHYCCFPFSGRDCEQELPGHRVRLLLLHASTVCLGPDYVRMHVWHQ